MPRLAENRDVDIVHVVTPNALHAEHTIAAVKAGKQPLCVKPMEISVERCQAMIAAARSAGVQLAIAYRCQFEPHHLECVRLARDGAFGRLLSIEAGFGFPIGGGDQWRLDHALSGGPLMDVGIYALQTARMLTAYAERGSFGMRPAYNYRCNAGWRSDGLPLSFPSSSSSPPRGAISPTASGAAGQPECPGRRGCATWRPTNRHALAQPSASNLPSPEPALRPSGCDHIGPAGPLPTSTAAAEILAPGAGLCHDFHP